MASQPHNKADAAQAPRGLDPQRFQPANRKRLSGPALRTFLAIADLWDLSEEQRRLVLGYPSRSTYHNWCRAVRQHIDITLDVDVLMRISAIFGIHAALGVLFNTEEKGIGWLKGPHHAPLFGGQAPINLVTSGSFDEIMLVRRFLDGARGGGYMPPNAIDTNFQPYADRDITFA